MVEASDRTTYRKPLLTAGFPVSKSHQLSIDLKEPGTNYRAGQKIDGVIRFRSEDFADGFAASALTMRLVGFNQAAVHMQVGKINRRKEKIIDAHFKLH